MSSRWIARVPAVAALGAMTYAASGAAAPSATIQEPAGQEPGAPAAATPEQGLGQLQKQMAEGGVRLDLERKLIEIDAMICQNREPLEFLLVTERGKDHEALLECSQVSAEMLNTAMLLLGVEPGENVAYSEVDPAPTAEEIAAGAPVIEVEPAHGDGFYLYVSWEVTDAEGKTETRFYRAEDLVVNVQDERTYQRGRWVYLGSRFIKPHKDAKEYFAAEGEGDLISIVYFSPANHLLTGADPAADNQYIWFPNIFLMPEIGAPVRLLFSLEKLDQAPPRLSGTAAATAE